ncbi:MAG TPA: type III secretion system translocon subunit SctB [Usitatibacter sp.]|nr:type III secretion system translocon subunit SctB [Usitatibacter sp.]
MSTIGGVGAPRMQMPQVLDEALVKDLKSKGLTDAAIAQLQLSMQNLTGNDGTGTGQKLPPGDVKGKDVLKLNDALSNASTNLHADIFTFMALFQKMAQDMRQTARLDREMQLQAQVSTLQAAADQIKQAAQAKFQAAIISGAMQIGAGAVQIGAAGMSAKTLSGAKGADPATSQVLTTKAGNWTTAGQGLGQIMQGAGTIGAGSKELEAGEAEAKGKKLDAQAKVEEEARQKANDVMQQMQDIIRDIRDKLAAIEQSNVEANRGIARNI